MARIAVTGGVAEGKSTVVDYLRELGYTTASSDDIAKDVFESEEVQDGLRSILGSEGPATPQTLRDKIWDHQALRRSVNRLMHPIILRELDRTGAEVVEIPLLVETCRQGSFPRVWVVTCGLEEQKRRLVQRLGDEATAEAILSSQLPSDVKAVFADVIVRTNRPPEDVKRFVTAVAARLVQ